MAMAWVRSGQAAAFSTLPITLYSSTLISTMKSVPVPTPLFAVRRNRGVVDEPSLCWDPRTPTTALQAHRMLLNGIGVTVRTVSLPRQWKGSLIRSIMKAHGIQTPGQAAAFLPCCLTLYTSTLILIPTVATPLLAAISPFVILIIQEKMDILSSRRAKRITQGGM